MPAERRAPRLSALILGAALLAPLAGCGDGGERIDISLVLRTISYDRSYVREIAAVEMHRAPFPGLSQAQTAALLRLPGSYGEALGLGEAVAAGDASEGLRLVLVFNGRAPITDRDICVLKAEMGHPEPLTQSGFTADAALCSGGTILVSGSVKAEAGDAAGRDAGMAERALNQLLTAMFGNSAERAAINQRTAPSQ